MLIGSHWRLTYDPGGADLVIVDFGQALADELRFPWRQQIQGGTPVRGAGAINLARGSVQGGLTLTVIQNHANAAAARQWCLDLPISLNAFAGVNGKVLKVESKNTPHYYQLAAATISSAEPAMRIAGKARTHTVWEIGGTIWTKVTPP